MANYAALRKDAEDYLESLQATPIDVDTCETLVEMVYLTDTGGSCGPNEGKGEACELGSVAPSGLYERIDALIARSYCV
jgi:hypothetical protein